jgi:hypothetical protein
VDIFVEKMRALDVLAENERITAIDAFRKKCICVPCPSYNDCMRAGHERLYCIAGKSAKCTIETRACICPSCPLKAEIGLTKAYYCTRGSEKEIRGV